MRLLNVLPTLALLGLMGLTGCGGGLERFPTAPVTGQVICEGQPVPYAMVYFEPLKESDQAIVGKPAFAIADDNGNFTLATYGQEDGAVIGKHRVRVDPPVSDKLPEGWSCPCEMNANTDVMQVDVVEGDNTFTVALKKKTRRSGALPSDDDDEEEGDLEVNF